MRKEMDQDFSSFSPPPMRKKREQGGRSPLLSVQSPLSEFIWFHQGGHGGSEWIFFDPCRGRGKDEALMREDLFYHAGSNGEEYLEWMR